MLTVDVSPAGAGLIEIVDLSSGKTQNPTSYPTSYDCFDYGDEVSLEAIPAAGYQFDHWTADPWPDGFSRTGNPSSFINKTAHEFTAYFVGGTPPPPLPPDNVSASDGTYKDRIRITWDASSGATSYEVYRAVSSGGTKTKITTSSNITYDDTAISCGTTYYYWVKAKNSDGTSGFSSYDTGYCSGSEPPPPPPPPPADVEGVNAGQAKAMIEDNMDLIVVDVRDITGFEAGHILCARNYTWNTMFSGFNNNTYTELNPYKDYDILVYDQSGTTQAEDAAEFLAGQGFSSVYYMTGGLDEWIANGEETIPAGCECEPCSLPPMADAGPDQTVNENEPVTLDGSGSGASGGGDLAYLWSQYQGTGVTLSNPAAVQPTFTAPYVQEGGETLVFHLTVTDDKQNQDSDSVEVTVTWINDPPIADAGEPQTVKEGDSVMLDGSGSSDPDDGIASYRWSQISGPAVTLSNSTDDKPTFTAPEVDADATELTFQLIVTDFGSQESTGQVTVTVNKRNLPPVADAGPNQTVNEANTVILDGSGSTDPDNGVKSYLWGQVGGPAVVLVDSDEMNASFVAPSVNGDPVTLTFQLIVQDNGGLVDSDEVNIIVKDVGVPPVADAGDDQTVYGGDTVTLDASGSTDPDGVIKSYEWHQISGPTVSLSGSTTANPTFEAPVGDGSPVTLGFQVIVKDNKGMIGTDQVLVTIENNTAPKADAGPDQAVDEGDTVVLDGSGSTDTDDGIKGYAWSQVSGRTVTLSGASTAAPTFVAPGVDKDSILVFKLTVEDYGGQTDTDQVKITVKNHSGSSGGCFISSMGE